MNHQISSTWANCPAWYWITSWKEGSYDWILCQFQFRQEALSRPQPREHFVYSTLLWWHYLDYACTCCCCWILFHKTGYDWCNSFNLYPHVEELTDFPAKLSRQQLQVAVIMVGNEIASHICKLVHFAVCTRFYIIICKSLWMLRN